MFKRGSLFLAILLCAAVTLAQDKTADMFKTNNPNLMNLNEPKEYNGGSLVYIEGVKAPEVANNDMDALKLKLFGTKNVREATKDTLKFENTTSVPQNQIHSFTFQTPLHQTVQAGFIRHIPDFLSVIHIIDQEQLTVTENITLMNTEEEVFFERTMPMTATAEAELVSFIQNGQQLPVNNQARSNQLNFKSTIPLQLGPNQLTLTYNIFNPFQGNTLFLPLTGLDIGWAIERFKTRVLFPNTVSVSESKLVYGANNLEIEDIYRQTTDGQNLSFVIDRIVPPNGSVQLDLTLDKSALPLPENAHITLWILVLSFGLYLLYWLGFGWWENRTLKGNRLPKIKYPTDILVLATQMQAQFNTKKWQELIEFGKKNNWPTDKLVHQQKQSTTKESLRKTELKSFWNIASETVWGTALLLAGTFITLLNVEEKFPCLGFAILTAGAFLGVLGLYHFALKKGRHLFWQKKLRQLLTLTVLAGLTQNQVRQIYPLFILTGNATQFKEALMKQNPKMAKQTHLI